MTAEAFRTALEACGWSANWLAGQIGVAPSTVKAWRDGRSRVPADVAAWVARAAAYLERHPPPRR